MMHFQQFLVRQARLEGDIEQSAFAEGVDAELRDGVGNKNFGFGHGTGNASGGGAQRHAYNGSVSYSEQR